MNSLRTCITLAPLLVCAPLLAQDSPAPTPPPPVVEAQALAIVGRASDYLAATKQFSTTVELAQDVVSPKGHKVQFSKKIELKLRRPDRLLVEISTTTPKRSFWYDGKSITLLDHRDNFYATSPAPNKIDAMVDQLEEALGVVFPLDDLLQAKPLVTPAASAKAALYLGQEQILGKACHHVAFQHDAIDWQAWVEAGPRPLLRKIVITLKLDEGSPQITALLTGWDLGTKLPDFVFQFDPPTGARKIEFLPAGEKKAAAASAPAPEESKVR